jgi:hypothetical protein
MVLPQAVAVADLAVLAELSPVSAITHTIVFRPDRAAPAREEVSELGVEIRQRTESVVVKAPGEERRSRSALVSIAATCRSVDSAVESSASEYRVADGISVRRLRGPDGEAR